MRCRTARRWLSDELDGALAPRPRLEAHLQACPACRTYREGIGLIQDRAGLADDRSPASWSAFERALDAKLDALEETKPDVVAPPASRRRWAWAAAAASVLMAMTAWYALQRSGGPVALETWNAYDDVVDPLVQAADGDVELAARVDREVGAMIDELAPAPDTEGVALPAADPLFWEGLSDDDLRGIVADLEEQTGRGGPA